MLSPSMGLIRGRVGWAVELWKGVPLAMVLLGDSARVLAPLVFGWSHGGRVTLRLAHWRQLHLVHRRADDDLGLPGR